MDLFGKTYLITGGSGFLGCHVAEELLKRGAKVRSLDIAPLGERSLIGSVDAILGDVRNVDDVRRALEGVDRVVHTAAALPLASRQEIISTNVEGTRIVMREIQKQGKAKVVHISSTAVYGVPKKHPIDEDDLQVGVGAYGESKVLSEQMIQDFRREGSVITSIRPKTFIGTGRLGVFQILFDWVQKGARIPVIGSGKNRYQLLEVNDLVEAILLAAEGEEHLVNDNFNVGADRFGTVLEDLGALCEAAGKGSKVLPTPAMPVKAVLAVLEKMRLSPLYKWVYGTADKDSFVSTDKIQRTLGWRPQSSNAETLVNTYRWYEEAYEEYRGDYGTTHKVAWAQGALGVVRKILGG
ncbi:MAG: NAD-dependent epimerase/dehydratase family protein [Candidatus Gracilibacteria bacterium]|nr:NAD-dependent epimerase/dehydratase family protein [bacterium]MDZ4216843.1 NAD-dependent epimerase/dehydratase family protein [Candidatus Gracilibacteria bacterium]